MKTIVIISSAVLVVLGTVSGALLVGSYHSTHNLRDTNRKLEMELQVLQALTDGLRSDREETMAQLVRAQDSVQSLRAQIAEIESANTNEVNTAVVPPVVAPYRVPAYLGRELLGQAWVVPRNLHLDTNLQRYVYEPVILLDESFRNSFVTYYTNVVEREIPTTYVDNNYYPQPVYYATGVRHHELKHFPKPPQTPVLPLPPPPPKFNPGNGTVTPQRLGTPASEIKTRPQVLGTPNNPVR